ncbi:MAG TPA: hypothetical protein VHY79_13970 [Rhizomicrobium sp.]|jgi:hypothetical protein|nr:hypothetical protein [Rhizomicrobium sp.]
MRSETFDFISNFSTLWQVILGAFLATCGGLVANQLEWRTLTRRRERNAALFFGEVLSSFALLLKRADETKKIGDPYGAITLRVLRSARREIDIYERNRESLLDLRDAGLRARIHGLTIRLSLPLDGIADAAQEIGNLKAQLRSRNLDERDREEFGARLAEISERREAGYEFVLETAAEIDGVLADLSPLAGHDFTHGSRF